MKTRKSPARGKRKPAAARPSKDVRARTMRPAKRAARGKTRPAEDLLREVKERLREIDDLGYSGAVLSWDQATYMPPGGAQARGRQGALLSRLVHERKID